MGLGNPHMRFPDYAHSKIRGLSRSNLLIMSARPAPLARPRALFFPSAGPPNFSSGREFINFRALGTAQNPQRLWRLTRKFMAN